MDNYRTTNTKVLALDVPLQGTFLGKRLALSVTERIWAYPWWSDREIGPRRLRRLCLRISMTCDKFALRIVCRPLHPSNRIWDLVVHYRYFRRVKSLRVIAHALHVEVMKPCDRTGSTRLQGWVNACIKR